MHRLTITLDDELYAMARAYAITSKISISKAIAELLRQRTGSRSTSPPPPPLRENESGSYFDPVLGILVNRSAKPLTEEDIQRALDDEDVRHLEVMGLSPEEIQRCLHQ